MITKEQIKTKLINLGCPISYQGFYHLQEILKIACEDERKLVNLRANIYPDVAIKCKTTPGNIEHTIRTIISNLDLEAINNISQRKLINPPTVKEFITLLVQHINYECDNYYD